MSNAAFTDFDSLLNSSMDDLDDLPPVGVPPTGHYTLVVSAERVTPTEAGKNEYIKFSYEVEAVNEVKNPEEDLRELHADGNLRFFFKFKKDGTVNDFGVGFLKEAIAPFAAHFGTRGIGESLQAINKVMVAASLIRKPDRKDPERFNFSLKDVVVL